MRRAFSLTEVVIAVFLLVVAAFIFIRLMHASMRYQARSARFAVASRLAQNTMAEVRAWGAKVNNFHSDWTPWNGVTRTDPSAPGYTVFVDCIPITDSAYHPAADIYTPSAALEQSFGAEARLMTDSVVPVRVRATWNPADPEDSVTLLSHIAEPVRTLGPDPLKVTASAATVSSGASVTVNVVLSDASNNRIGDVSYYWSPLPLIGNGTLLHTGNRFMGSNTLKNEYLSNGIPITVPGVMNVNARAAYHGQEITDPAPPSIDMLP